MTRPFDEPGIAAPRARRNHGDLFRQRIWDWKLGGGDRASESDALAIGRASRRRLAGHGGGRDLHHAFRRLAGAAAWRNRHTSCATVRRSLAFACLLPGLAPNLPIFFGCAFLLGASNGLMDVPMNAHATVVERGWGAAIMSSFHAAWSCGGLVGAAVGGLLIHAGASASGQLGVGGVAVLLMALASVPQIGAGELGGKAGAFAWPERSLIGLCVIALLAMLVEGAMTDWSAVYLTSVIGLTPASAAGGYAIYASAMLTGRLCGDNAVRALGRAQVIMLGAGLAAAGILVAVVTTSPIAAIGGFFLVGLGLSNMIPAVFSASRRNGLLGRAGNFHGRHGRLWRLPAGTASDRRDRFLRRVAPRVHTPDRRAARHRSAGGVERTAQSARFVKVRGLPARLCSLRRTRL